LMERFHMDPNRLSRTSVVAEASAAILKTACFQRRPDRSPLAKPRLANRTIEMLHSIGLPANLKSPRIPAPVRKHRYRSLSIRSVELGPFKLVISKCTLASSFWILNNGRLRKGHRPMPDRRRENRAGCLHGLRRRAGVSAHGFIVRALSVAA